MAGQCGGVVRVQRRTFPLFLGIVESVVVYSAECGVLGVAATGVFVRGKCLLREGRAQVSVINVSKPYPQQC